MVWSHKDVTQMKNDSLSMSRATHSGASGIAFFCFLFLNLKSTGDALK